MNISDIHRLRIDQLEQAVMELSQKLATVSEQLALLVTDNIRLHKRTELLEWRNERAS